MDINVIIRRSAIYSVTVGVLVAGYILLVMAAQAVFQQFWGEARAVAPVITALAALTIALAFEPLKQRITALIDRAFYKGRYNYQATVRKFSRVIAATLSLESLSRFIVRTVNETLKVENAALLLRDEPEGRYRIRASEGLEAERVRQAVLSEDSSLVEALATKDSVIIREELEHILPRHQAGKIAEECARLGAELALPLIFQGKVVGILSLGAKRSGDIYSSEDLELLGTLINQVVVALENAKLYSEVVAGRDWSENILRNLANGAITIDEEGVIESFNRSAENITGFPASQAIGRHFREVCREKNEGLAGIITDTMEAGKTYTSSEMKWHKSDGSEVYIGVSTSQLKDHEGRALGTVVVLANLTPLKQLEEKVRRIDRLASLGTMAAGMAHEIKNPLVSIKTFVQLLPQRFADAEFRDEFSRLVGDEVEKINNIVKRLLDFSRPTPLQLQPLDVAEAIDETLFLLDIEIGRSNIQVEKKSKGGLPKVLGDKEQLKQVFLNLFLNSLQAMEEGGRLAVETSSHDEKVAVKIRDTGCGIPAQNISKLYNPFFTTKEKGSGLGLSIVHRIIVEHNGAIDFESNVGQGTTVTVELPVAKTKKRKVKDKDKKKE